MGRYNRKGNKVNQSYAQNTFLKDLRALDKKRQSVIDAHSTAKASGKKMVKVGPLAQFSSPNPYIMTQRGNRNNKLYSTNEN